MLNIVTAIATAYGVHSGFTMAVPAVVTRAVEARI